MIEAPERHQPAVLQQLMTEAIPLSTSERYRLFENIVSLYLLQGVNYAIPLAVLPYLVRVLGMETYGLVAFAQSFAMYFNVLIDYGFNFSATRATTQHKDDVEQLSQIFCCVFLIKLILTVVASIALVCILHTVPRMRHDWPIFVFAFAGVVGNAFAPIWYFQGLERMRYVSVITGGTKLLSAALLFVFVHHPQDALLAIAIQSLGLILACLIGIVVCLRWTTIHLRWPSWAQLKMSLIEGWHVFVSTTSMSLYTNTNVFLVGMLAGNVQAGYFSAADKLIRAAGGVVGPITQAMFPYLNSLARTSTESALAFIAQSLRWVSGITLLPALALFLFARPIALLCFGHAADGAIPVLRWIAPLPFLIAVSNILGVQTMLTFGLDRQFSRILIAAGVLNVVLAIPLISLYRAQGAGASVLLVEALVTLAMGLALRWKGINIRLWGTVTK